MNRSCDVTRGEWGSPEEGRDPGFDQCLMGEPEPGNMALFWWLEGNKNGSGLTAY